MMLVQACQNIISELENIHTMILIINVYNAVGKIKKCNIEYPPCILDEPQSINKKCNIE
jgi:hypothetical protein